VAEESDFGIPSVSKCTSPISMIFGLIGGDNGDRDQAIIQVQQTQSSFDDKTLLWDCRHSYLSSSNIQCHSSQCLPFASSIHFQLSQIIP
jgi:hypothetical protein